MLRGKRIAVVCGGQGSQSKDLGGFLKLIREFKVVENLINEGKEVLGLDRMSSLLNLIEKQDDIGISKTNNTQPLLFLHSCSIANILENKGLISFSKNSTNECKVQCIFGHSLGEFAALVLSGALDFKKGLQLVHHRGNLMNNAVEKEIGEFVMMAIIPKTQLEPYEFRNKLEIICKKSSESTSKVCQIANINSSNQIVISGDKEAIDNVIRLGKSSQCENIIRRAIPLRVGAPFHCPLLKSSRKPMEEMLRSSSFKPFEIPFFSAVNAEKVIIFAFPGD